LRNPRRGLTTDPIISRLHLKQLRRLVALGERGSLLKASQ
jgi:hypothetical protein